MAKARKKSARPKTKIPDWADPGFIQPTKSTRTHIKRKPTTKKGGVNIPKVWRPEHVLGVRDKKK